MDLDFSLLWLCSAVSQQRESHPSLCQWVGLSLLHFTPKRDDGALLLGDRLGLGVLAEGIAPNYRYFWGIMVDLRVFDQALEAGKTIFWLEVKCGEK